MGNLNSLIIKTPCIPRKYKLKRLENAVVKEIQRYEADLQTSLAIERVCMKSIINTVSEQEAKRIFMEELSPQKNTTAKIKVTLNTLRRIQREQADHDGLRDVFSMTSRLLGDTGDAMANAIEDVEDMLYEKDLRDQQITAERRGAETYEDMETHAEIWASIERMRRDNLKKLKEQNPNRNIPDLADEEEAISDSSQSVGIVSEFT